MLANPLANPQEGSSRAPTNDRSISLSALERFSGPQLNERLMSYVSRPKNSSISFRRALGLTAFKLERLCKPTYPGPCLKCLVDPDKTWVWRLKSPGYTVRANGAGEAVKVSVGQHPNKLYHTHAEVRYDLWQRLRGLIV